MFAAANVDLREGANCSGEIDIRCHGPLGERDKNHYSTATSMEYDCADS